MFAASSAGLCGVLYDNPRESTGRTGTGPVYVHTIYMTNTRPTGLSLEFILRAATNYVEKLHAAHVAEIGGTARTSRPWQATSEIEAIQWYEGRAGDNTSDPVVAGNWNTVDTWNDDQCVPGRVTVPGGDVMARLGAIFEKLGYDVDWNDGVTGCGECNRAIQTQPDSYGWTPEFVVGDGWITCTQCMSDTGAWQDELDAAAHSQGSISNADVDPAEYGYTAVREMAFGWDGGTGDPEAVKSAMGGGIGYFFQLTDNRQFGQSAILWVANDDAENVPDNVPGDEIDTD